MQALPDKSSINTCLCLVQQSVMTLMCLSYCYLVALMMIHLISYGQHDQCFHEKKYISVIRKYRINSKIFETLHKLLYKLRRLGAKIDL